MEADLRRMELEKLISHYLGRRHPKAAYSYADVLKSLLYRFCIGGSVPDDLNTLRQGLKEIILISLPARLIQWNTCAGSSKNLYRKSLHKKQ